MSDDLCAVEETVDRVPGRPDITVWKRAARRHQCEWRASQGLAPGQPSKNGRFLGSRIADSEPQGSNFLHPGAVQAVLHRLAHPQPLQTLDKRRLERGLLSSMPMCFNLFGPLWADPALAAATAHRWFPDLCPEDAAVTIKFEWSPGRADPTYLDDRTAFDVALFVTAGSHRTVIGIETKYHEHPTRPPKTKQGVARPGPKERYLEVSANAGLPTGPGWIDTIWGSPFEQVWRDHLLALACQQAGDYDQASYVLVAPAANPSWSETVEQYLVATPAAGGSCSFRSIEDLVAVADDLLPHANVFRERYVNIEVSP